MSDLTDEAHGIAGEIINGGVVDVCMISTALIKLALRIEQLEAERQWISVKDRLPEEGASVAVWVRSRDRDFDWQDIDWWEDWWWDAWNNSDYEVLYWMTQPPPPEEEA